MHGESIRIAIDRLKNCSAKYPNLRLFAISSPDPLAFCLINGEGQDHLNDGGSPWNASIAGDFPIAPYRERSIRERWPMNDDFSIPIRAVISEILSRKWIPICSGSFEYCEVPWTTFACTAGYWVPHPNHEHREAERLDDVFLESELLDGAMALRDIFATLPLGIVSARCREQLPEGNERRVSPLWIRELFTRYNPTITRHWNEADDPVKVDRVEFRLDPWLAFVTVLESLAGNEREQDGPPAGIKGCVGAIELANMLGVQSTKIKTFIRQLDRKRKELGDAFHQVAEPRPNSPRFLYDAASPAIRALAEKYK